MLGDFPWVPTHIQQLLCLGCDLRRHHRSAVCRTRHVERFHATSAILVDAANDAVFRHTEGPQDIHLATNTLADELSGKHSERAVVVLGVLKHRLSAEKYVHWPLPRTTLIRSLMCVAPSVTRGNNAWGMVPSSW